AQTFAFTPPLGLPNGQYVLVVSAAANERTATATVPLVIDDILTGLAAKGTSLSFTLARAPVSLVFQVSQGASLVATPVVPPPSVGPQTLTWDGTLSGGPRASDGVYVLALTIADDAVTFTRSVAITL